LSLSSWPVGESVTNTKQSNPVILIQDMEQDKNDATNAGFLWSGKVYIAHAVELAWGQNLDPWGQNTIWWLYKT